MKAKKFLALALVLLLGFALSCEKCLAIEQHRFHSEANGYSIGVPTGWTKMPDSVLQETFKALFAKAAEPTNFVWEVAFQRDAESLWLQYPYAIIQVMKYSNFGLNRQIYRSELKTFTKTLSGLDVNDVMDGLSADAQDFISEAVLDEVLLDVENKNYLFGMEMDVAGVGKANGQMRGYFGKYAVIQVMFYDLESNWSDSTLERNTILSSFEFDPSMTYNEAAESPVGFFERRAMEALPVIVLVLIVGGIGAAWGYIGRRIRQRAEQKQ